MEQEMIIRKIKGLLAKAHDHANDEECQTALVMAKRWMVKYHITRSDLTTQEMGERFIQCFECFEWWEELLSALIAEQFRVRAFYRLSVGTPSSTALYFYGLNKDLSYAHSIFILAYESLKGFIQNHLKRVRHLDKQAQKQSLNDYLSGFLQGLREKFKRQSEQIQAISSPALMLVLEVPQQVSEQFKIKSQNYEENCLKLPEVKDIASYQTGYLDSETMTLDLRLQIEEGE